MKQFRNLIVILLAMSLCITVVLSATAVDEGGDPQQSETSETVSTVSETEEETESEVVSSESQSKPTYEEPTESTEQKPSVTSSKSQTKQSSSKSVTTKKTTSAKTSSKKVKNESKKSSGAVGKRIDHSSSVTSTSDSYTPDYSSYDDTAETESISGEWDSDKKILEVNEPEKRELTKNITNPKKQMQIWLFLPIVIGLACIGILIYVNIYLPKHPEKSWIYGGKSAKGSAEKTAKGGKHSAKNGVKTYKPGDFSKNKEQEDTKPQADPYSADNFFNFDDDK